MGFFTFKNEGAVILRNVRKHSPNFKASYPIWYQHSSTPL